MHICNNHEETLTHFFWGCEHIQTIVQYVTNVLNINNVNMTTLSCQDMLLGICIEKMNPINILLLEIKRYIFMCKRTNTIPNVPGLKRTLLLSWEIQKQTTRQNYIFPNWSVVRIFVEWTQANIIESYKICTIKYTIKVHRCHAFFLCYFLWHLYNSNVFLY